MFIIYQLIISLLFIISPIIIFYRISINKEDPKRYKEKFAIPSKKKIKGKLIWFHGASVGEIMSIVPLLKNYEKDKSINQILVTSSTLSSSKVIKKFKLKKITHQFYPIDHFLFNDRFLKYWKPKLAIFIESEIWPSMFKSLKNKNIPLILLNARLTRKTFLRWMKIKNFTKSIFNKINIAYPQNLETKSYLKKINIRKIKLIGNLKFIENSQDNFNKIDKKLNFQLKKRKIWIASSTHKKEEIFCAKTHLELKKKYKNILTIIIPRHVHRAKEISEEIKTLGLKVAFHSSKLKQLNEVDVYIVDTFGETQKFHKIASSVFLGGSIINRGGQNPLEAARFGAKIFHGPDTSNFKDIYMLLRSLNVSIKINNPKQLASSIVFKKNKLIGNKIKKIGKKILTKTIKELDNHIQNEFKKT